MWIQEENENGQGSKNCESQTSSGTQETLRLRFKFPKTARLRKRNDYQRLSRFGRRLQGKSVSFDYRIEGSSSPRLGITVSKKYGSACARNRFKRLVRETFRELLPTLPKGLDVNVHPSATQEFLSKNLILDDFHLINLLRN